MIIYEGTNILVSGAFLKCFSIYKSGKTRGNKSHEHVFMMKDVISDTRIF